MAKQLVMGNEAIGLGALRAGVGFVCGYPGTPSTEILETVAKHNPGDVYVEWSVNEKAAMEAAAGAAYAGARAMVTMKQVGLNVASDPLMSLAYIGVKGGMVIVAADDPGPISSQTEQDTRHFARFSKLPVFDPASPEEAFEMIGDAFDYSEKYQTPVLLRPTTRVCHGCASIEMDESRKKISPEGFVKDSKWVICPRLTYQNHKKVEARQPMLGEDFSSYRFNEVTGGGRQGIAAGGVSAAYAKEALAQMGKCPKFLKVATPHPFPERLALSFLEGLDEVLVLEELDPVIERELVYLCGKHHLPVRICGKLTGHTPNAGENSTEIANTAIRSFLGLPQEESMGAPLPSLPVRPPVLCAGCPHRASFYAVKRAVESLNEGREDAPVEGVYCGDIGCYTLGNAKPLDMVDTCLCMGAGITMAQGLSRVEPDKRYFSFVGDSTFFASGITGIVNAVYNQANLTVCVLDNSTTAMTGHQPHPGTGHTMMGQVVDKVSIEKVLEAVGVTKIVTVDPLDLELAVNTVKEVSGLDGVKAVIFKSPCIAVVKPTKRCRIDPDRCVHCRTCITEIGCPALVLDDGQVKIESGLCTGCGLCGRICSVGAIEEEVR